MKELDKYCRKIIAKGAAGALVTEPKRIVTAPWVRWRCQFGCPDYGKFYCCPPDTPTWEQTRQVLDSYNRIILCHFQTKDEEWEGTLKKYTDSMVALENELFLDGFYRAFSLLAGHCALCKECAKVKNQPCVFPAKARPSMEACGIDVFQTARNHGLPISTLQTHEETRNIYLLTLVD